jgi:hypothetical protein
MANGKLGRPKAAELSNRCAAKNAHGGRCGNPPILDGEICPVHLGKADPKKLVGVSDRLIKLTGMALDRLEEIIRDGADDVAERACRTVLDRTAPKPNAQSAIQINLNPPAIVDGRVLSPAEIVRDRLEQLALTTAARQRQDLEDSDVIDAELVEESAS